MAKDSPFKLETRRSLAEQVADRITGLIVDGDLSPGERLPPEVDLADRMGVSRTALREGMRTLEARGLLEIQPGVGTVVREVGSDQLVVPLSLYVEASRGAVTVDESYAVRELLETEAAGLAAAAATEHDIAVLRGFVSAMAESTDDVGAFAVNDANFHSALSNMASNPLLGLLIGAIRGLLEDHIREVVQGIDPIEVLLQYHVDIVDAIAAGDEVAARTAMADHFRQVRELY